MTDLTNSSYSQLLNLIKQENGLSNELTESDVDFINPTALEGHQTGKNTAVLVQSKPNTRYVGNVSITYNRMDLVNILSLGNTTLSISADSQDVDADLISSANAIYGINLSADDVAVVDAELVDYDGEFVTFNAKSISLAWIGTVDFLAKFNQTALSSILVESTLAGLDWPILVESQTITFGQPSNKDFGTTFTVDVSASSGLAVTLASLTPSVCQVDSQGLVSFSTIGTCSIIANQDGNEYFYPADEVIRSFLVEPVVPGAPTNITATAGMLTASVSFTTPSFNGGSAISKYRVTSNPGSISAEGAESPIVVSGLTANAQYTFTVEAYNEVGYSDPSVPSASVTILEEVNVAKLAGVQDATINTGRSRGFSSDGLCSLVYQDKMYVGRTTDIDSISENSLKVYDFTNNTWATVTSFVVAMQQLARSGNRIYAVSSSGLRYYDIVAQTVSAISGFSGMNYANGASSADYIGKMARVADDGNFIYLLSTDRMLSRYDPATNTITRISQNTIHALSIATNNASAVIANGYFYYVHQTNSPLIRFTFRCNLSTGVWEELAQSTQNLMNTNLVYDGGNHLYLFGGNAGSYINGTSALRSYNISTNVWDSTSVTGSTPRSSNSCCFYNGKLYSFGGINVSGAYLNLFLRIR